MFKKMVSYNIKIPNSEYYFKVKKYNKWPLRPPITRVNLHAWQLNVPHPLPKNPLTPKMRVFFA